MHMAITNKKTGLDSCVNERWSMSRALAWEEVGRNVFPGGGWVLCLVETKKLKRTVHLLKVHWETVLVARQAIWNITDTSLVTSWFFGDKIVLRGICSLPLKRVPWYHRGPQSNRQSCPPDWCQRCPERQAWVRLSLYGGFWILTYGGILLTFQGVIINTPDWCQRCPVRQAWVGLISDLVIVTITTSQRN